MFVSVSAMAPVPLPAALLIPVTAARVQLNVVPATVLVGVYANAVPLVAVAVRLLVNAGVGLGAAVPLADGLVQPFTVCLTVYVPAVVTVIEAVVAPVLHNKDPVNDPAVNKVLLQLFVTVTVGAGTLEFIGAATPLPGELVHPLTVCVTEYVPAAVTVIDAVFAPVFHNNEPENEPAVRVELPQLFTTVTVGVPGMEFTVNVAGLELTELVLLVHTALYCLLLSPVAALKVKVAAGCSANIGPCGPVSALLPLHRRGRSSACCRSKADAAACAYRLR